MSFLKTISNKISSETSTNIRIDTKHLFRKSAINTHSKNSDDVNVSFGDIKPQSYFPKENDICLDEKIFMPRVSTFTLAKSENCDLDEHFSKLGHNSTILRSKNVTHDIILRVGVYCFKVHRIVLSSYSPYLKKKLENFNKKEHHKIRILGMKPYIMKILLHYMYTGELQLTCQTFVDVFYGARNLKMKCALTKCAERLRERYEGDFGGYFYTYVVAEHLLLAEQWVKALQFIFEHLRKCLNTKEFLELNVKQLCGILSSDLSKDRDEKVIFFAALKWLNHKPETRMKHATYVMSCVRFTLMNQRELLLCFYPPIGSYIVKLPSVKNMLFYALLQMTSVSLNLKEHFENLSTQQSKIFEIWNQEDILELLDIPLHEVEKNQMNIIEN